MTRNVIDTLGAVVGTLTLPDSTSEDIWTYQLALYSNPPPSLPNVSASLEVVILQTIGTLPSYANNTAALASGLVIGSLYLVNGVVTVVL